MTPSSLPRYGASRKPRPIHPYFARIAEETDDVE
jgi:hypothetical protein